MHQKLLQILKKYLAIGGMPEAVLCWKQTNDAHECEKVHHVLIDTYRQDFGKYAKKFQIKYLSVLFNAVSYQIGKKFTYSRVEGDYRKRDLSPCLDLLITAGIVHSVIRTTGNGMKTIFIDTALNQAIMGFDIKEWFLNTDAEFINKGILLEGFVGQELLVYAQPSKKFQLHYWRRSKTGSEAEVDYLIQKGNHIIPLEVKSGKGSQLKSLRLFLEEKKNSPYGIRVSTHNYSFHDKLHSYPLYAVAHIFMEEDHELKRSLEFLCE